MLEGLKLILEGLYMKNLLIVFVLVVTLLCATILTLTEVSLFKDINNTLKEVGELINSGLDWLTTNNF